MPLRVLPVLEMALVLPHSLHFSARIPRSPVALRIVGIGPHRLLALTRASLLIEISTRFFSRFQELEATL